MRREFLLRALTTSIFKSWPVLERGNMPRRRMPKSRDYVLPIRQPFANSTARARMSI
jgi:hypothetical protein